MSLKAVLAVLLLIVAANCTQGESVLEQPVEGEKVTVSDEPEDGNVYTPDDEPIEIEQRQEEVALEQPTELTTPQKQEEEPQATPIKAAPQSYLYESMLISLVFMFLMNYKSGKRTNEVIADRWVRSVMNIVKENFALVGFGDVPSQEDQAVILEESAHEYSFYASGRQNLHFFEASFELRRREDLLSFYGMELVFPERDLVTIDIPMECSTPLVFCLAKKKELKNLKQKCADLNFLTKDFGVAGLADPYRILGENTESIDFVFDGYVVKNINQLSSILYSIHYTDQKLFTHSPGHLKLVLNANGSQPEKNEQAIRLALYIVDRVTALKLPQNIKAKSEKTREAFAATKEKEELEKKLEEIQKQKAEKRRQEEQRIKHLPPEKQRKALDALRNKEMSKRLRGRVMKVM